LSRVVYIGVSNVVWSILLIIFLVIGLAIGYMIPRPGVVSVATQTQTITVPGPGGATITMPITVTSPAAVAGLPKEIPIGVLDALSGAFASFGIRGQTAVKLAEKDINDFVNRLGLGVRFVFYYEDFAGKPDVALQKLQILAAKGVKVIIGGIFSAAAKQMAPYADANKIVVIASASTVPREEVAPAGDYVFRTLPTTEAEGAALGMLMKELGIKNVIMITPEEICMLAFRKAYLDIARKVGINVALDLTYPYGTKDFNPILDQMEKAAKPYIDRGEPYVVIANVWEDEAVQLLNQAKMRNSPLLNTIWFTSDAVPMSTVVLQQAGDIANKIKLIGTLFTGAASKVYDHVRDYMKSVLGQEPDIYALAEYDSAWIAALAILLAGKYDGDAIKNALPLATKIYWGATGNIEFNEKGDRAYADVAFYAVINKEWRIIGVYKVLENKVSWILSPQEILKIS
jgi:branched-chain amino acid transport system substrate-binding protein